MRPDEVALAELLQAAGYRTGIFGKWHLGDNYGYVSDVITDAAIAFIEANRTRPFFTYLAFNAPHTPLEVPASYYEKYRQAGLAARDFPSAWHPIPEGFDPETTARVYGMVGRPSTTTWAACSRASTGSDWLETPCSPS